MSLVEYKVIPAPTKGLKEQGLKGPEAYFANALEKRMNELASEGWQYLRSDLLPSQERQGLTSSQTVYRSVLVFQRPISTEADRIDDNRSDAIENNQVIAEEAAPDPVSADTETVETEEPSHGPEETSPRTD